MSTKVQGLVNVLRTVPGIDLGKIGMDAPQFSVGGWEFAIEKVTNFRTICYRYGEKTDAWLWQPELRGWMGRDKAPRDQAKLWFFEWTARPERLRDFLGRLEALGKDSRSESETATSRGHELTRAFDATVRDAIPIGDEFEGSETELHRAMLDRPSDLRSGLRLEPIEIGSPWERRSQPDLMGRRVGDHNYVAVEVKKSHLKFATLEALAYARHWKKHRSEPIEAIYVCAKPRRDEVVRAKVLSVTAGIPVSVFSYSYRGGKFTYTECE